MARKRWHRPMMAALTLFCLGAPPAAAQTRETALLGSRLCATLAIGVDSIPGKGPAFLRSYDAKAGSGAPEEPALATAAFTYDNALAAIALLACGEQRQAQRIGEALLVAVTADRAAPNSRLRNTYRAGPQQERPVPPNGWWDEKQKRWLEDAYQVGTATGNVAWAGLALLSLAESTGDARYQQAAATLGAWVITHTHDERGPGGYTGGIHGFDPEPKRLSWKSTEHHADLLALFGWLGRLGVAGGDWATAAARSRAFLDALWRADSGYFPTGTLPDGVTVNDGNSGLDAQLWPLMLDGAPLEWRRALAFADARHGVEGGYDFNDDRDGMWVEGTAQAALAFRLVGEDARANRLLAGLAGQVSPGGYLWAVTGERISTGFAIGPDSPDADFFYYRQPHLGATAWAVLAAKGWNPFTGRRLPS